MAFDPATAVAELATSVINKIWPDKTEAEKQQLAAAVMIVQGQLDINKVEAANPSVFVSGWRPAVGWSCVLGLVYTFFGQPLMAWGSSLWGIPVPPVLALDTLLTLLAGMLGLGGLRTFEKTKGIDNK